MYGIYVNKCVRRVKCRRMKRAHSCERSRARTRFASNRLRLCRTAPHSTAPHRTALGCGRNQPAGPARPVGCAQPPVLDTLSGNPRHTQARARARTQNSMHARPFPMHTTRCRRRRRCCMHLMGVEAGCWVFVHIFVWFFFSSRGISFFAFGA